MRLFPSTCLSHLSCRVLLCHLHLRQSDDDFTIRVEQQRVVPRTHHTKHLVRESSSELLRYSIATGVHSATSALTAAAIPFIYGLHILFVVPVPVRNLPIYLSCLDSERISPRLCICPRCPTAAMSVSCKYPGCRNAGLRQGKAPKTASQINKYARCGRSADDYAG